MDQVKGISWQGRALSNDLDMSFVPAKRQQKSNSVTSAGMNIRVRGPTGQTTLTGLTAETTLLDFKALLADRTGVSSSAQELLAGFPPRPVQLPADTTALLSALGLRDGDTLVVRTATGSVASPAPQQPVAAATPLPIAAQVAAEAPVTAAGAAKPAASQQKPPDAPQKPPAAVAGHEKATRTPAAVSASPALRSLQRKDAALNGGTHSAVSHQSAATDDLTEDEELARAIAQSLQDPGTSAAAAAVPMGACGSSVGGVSQTGSGSGPAPPSQPLPEGAGLSVTLPDGTAVVRRVIDADNSCLFNAVGYVMQGSRSRAPALRKIIAEAVAGNPDTYTEGFLGKPNGEYCAWIQDSQRWGGGIELSILSEHYGREIAAYDIQTQRCDIYGQDRGYADRVMLIYDGLHYDAMALAAFEGAPEEIDVTVFPADGEAAKSAERGAKALVAEAHQARQFTDIASFTLRCGVCQIGVKGEKEAVEHAKATGHQNFSEYH